MPRKEVPYFRHPSTSVVFTPRYPNDLSIIATPDLIRTTRYGFPRHHRAAAMTTPTASRSDSYVFGEKAVGNSSLLSCFTIMCIVDFAGLSHSRSDHNAARRAA